jgi:hypothetical protein
MPAAGLQWRWQAPPLPQRRPASTSRLCSRSGAWKGRGPARPRQGPGRCHRPLAAGLWQPSGGQAAHHDAGPSVSPVGRGPPDPLPASLSQAALRGPGPAPVSTSGLGPNPAASKLPGARYTGRRESCLPWFMTVVRLERPVSRPRCSWCRCLVRRAVWQRTDWRLLMRLLFVQRSTIASHSCSFTRGGAYPLSLSVFHAAS